MTPTQFTLFNLPDDANDGEAWPEGFRFTPALISHAEEGALMQDVAALPFAPFLFQGYVGKRRVVSFGWQYDFVDRTLRRVDDMPPFLETLRERVAAFAELDPTALQHVLVTEYADGAGIGWHRDKAVFGDVVGVSLGAPCTFRLRRAVGDTWERVSVVATPRSAYLLRGPSRTEWEHSIPSVEGLRYSITYRNLRDA